jgi:hypothetical protein
VLFVLFVIFELWIRVPGWKKSGSGSCIRDEHTGSYFQELRNNFFQFFRVKNTSFFDADSDPGSGIVLTLDPGSGMAKFGSGIR